MILQRKDKEHRGYGNPVESMKRAADIATSICGKPITAQDVVKVMMSVKLSREANAHKEDNLIDLAAYASILNDLEK